MVLQGFALVKGPSHTMRNNALQTMSLSHAMHFHQRVFGPIYFSYCDFPQLIEAERNRRHFADDMFKYPFLNENVLISIKIPLKFIPGGGSN